MSSERYSETRSYRENRRNGNDSYDVPFHQRVTVPIQHTSNLNRSVTDQRVQDRIHQQDSSLQWVNDPISGKEKFRININIDGFNQNEVNIRVDGNKLLVFGEHLENSNQSSAKKSIEKSYELPRDVDASSPRVTFPTLTTMQVDFPSRHSNVIIDDGRIPTNLISNVDTSFRTAPRLAEERSSTEYTSTRKVGGTGGSSFIGSSIPRNHSPYDDVYGGSNIGRNSSYTSTSNFQTGRNQSPIRQTYTTNFETNPTRTFNITTGGDFPPPPTVLPSTVFPPPPTVLPPTVFPSSSFGYGNGNVTKKSYSETHRETEERHSSPTTGVQSSREVQHESSGDPSIVRNIGGNRFQSKINFDGPNIVSSSTPSISRNVEVREHSRRIGNTGNNSSSFISNEPLLFSRDFNKDAFYRSAFQPQILTDNLGQQRIEMKLAVSNYQPNEVKVTVEGNDLIVRAEHNEDRPPTSSSRASFYKQVTLPPGTDLSTLSSQYHPDGRLHITAKLSGQNSIKYN